MEKVTTGKEMEDDELGLSIWKARLSFDLEVHSFSILSYTHGIFASGQFRSRQKRVENTNLNEKKGHFKQQQKPVFRAPCTEQK